MSIETYIANLRTKPETARKQIAFWSSVCVTLIIFIFWMASLTGATNTATNAVAQVVDKAGTPAQSLVASVGSLFGDIKDLIFTPKKITYSSVDVKPGK